MDNLTHRSVIAQIQTGKRITDDPAELIRAVIQELLDCFDDMPAVSAERKKGVE